MVGAAQLVGRDKQLRFVFKELPVLGPGFGGAAKAALAASKLDAAKYYDFHLALMQSKELPRKRAEDAAAQGLRPRPLAAEMEQDWVKSGSTRTTRWPRSWGSTARPASSSARR